MFLLYTPFAWICDQANLEAKNEHGNTALYLAAWNGHEGVVEQLLGAKADPRAKDNDGDTAARWAEAKGHSGLAQRLRKAEAQ